MEHGLMKHPFWEGLYNFVKLSTPFLLTIFFVLVDMVPLEFDNINRVTPLLPLMAIYYWVLFYPKTMPIIAVFAIGFLEGLLTGTPAGIDALVYMLVCWSILSQRRFLYGKSFVTTWLGFAIIAFGTQGMRWVLVVLYYQHLPALESFIFQYLISVGVYPFIAWFLSKWQQAVLGRDGHVS